MNELLHTYLNDHLAAATGGRNLARRAAGSNQATPYGAELDRLAQELAEDRDVVQRLMASLDVKANPVKAVAVEAAEVVGRLKANDRVFTYSPLSRVVELEGLVLAARSNLALWTALHTLQETEPRIAAIGIPALVERAESQLQRLEDLRLKAFQGAMLGDAPNRD